jgi:hypothetical protein
VYAKLVRAARRVRETAQITRLRFSGRRIPPAPTDAGVVVSLTSFPPRIQHAWIAIETVFRQDRVPARLVLVLAEDAFPARSLPRSLRRQQARGLEILWVPHDSGSFDKLVPTRRAYPDAVIVTVDDDARYAPWVVARLLDHAQRNPGTVVGHRGWEIEHDDGGLAPYVQWLPAGPDTPAPRVFLTGVGGVLYPPDVLPTALLTDVELARRLCPTNDDVWFWAVATVAGVPAQCLGSESFSSIRRMAGTPRLELVNRSGGLFDAQIARVIEHFRAAGVWPESATTRSR